MHIYQAPPSSLNSESLTPNLVAAPKQSIEMIPLLLPRASTKYREQIRLGFDRVVSCTYEYARDYSVMDSTSLTL